MLGSHGFVTLYDTVRERLLRARDMTPIAVPSELTTLEGVLRGEPVWMHTERFTGRDFEHLTVARIVDKSDRIVTLTVIGMPRSQGWWPILGMDIIALSGHLSLVAVDCASTHDATWARCWAPLLHELQAAVRPISVTRKRPAFAHSTFSEAAVIVGVKDGCESDAFVHLERFVRAFSSVSVPDTSVDEATSRAMAQKTVAWKTSELENRKEQAALSRVFGEDVAQRYLKEFLFAVS